MQYVCISGKKWADTTAVQWDVIYISLLSSLVLCFLLPSPPAPGCYNGRTLCDKYYPACQKQGF